MKKLILTSVLVGCLGFASLAQFLMKNNTHMLRSGDEHYFNITNNVAPGAKGPSVVWDFRNLETKSTLTSYMYSAYSTEKTAELPEANTVLEEYGTRFFFKASNGIIEQYGTVTKNNTLTKYDVPFVKMVFPFNYGDSYSGNFSGTIYGKNNYEAQFTGTYLLEADAYGTIILPDNITYDNVFRIKTVKEQCYNGKDACNCVSISYKWYAEDVRYPLLTIIQSQNSKGIKTIRTAYYSKGENKIDNDSPTKLTAQNVEVNIYPNPFMDEFKLDYTITTDTDVNIEIYDNSGRKLNSIQKLNQKAGYYTEIICNEDVKNQFGMFHIRVIAGNEVVSKTVIRGE